MKILDTGRPVRCISLVLMLLANGRCWGAPPIVKQIGSGLYAYISDDNASANATFLVSQDSVLVVDTGRNDIQGSKLLHAVRQVSKLPVRYIVNTHYHPDHQGGNRVVGPNAVIISTQWTRDKTIILMGDSAVSAAAALRPADVTFQQKLTLYAAPYRADVYFPGRAHTSGDAIVYFPQQHAIAMGDLFLNRSSPAMDVGSVKEWIGALDAVLLLPVETVVPGHFELGSKIELRRFRNYLSDLYQKVVALRQRGATLDQVRASAVMEKYRDFRQFPQFEATFADNAATIYRQLDGGN